MAEMKVVTLENLQYYTSIIDGKLEGKVDVREGFGLSTNDYTTAEKEALAKVVQDVEGIIAVGGQANVIETVKVDGVALVPDEAKAVNIDLSAYALKSDIVSAMFWRGTVATVDALPTDAAVGDIYHVTATGGEHAWDGSAWQELGSILDLSAYSTTEQVNGLISAAVAPKADKTYVDEQLALKAVKTEVEEALALKADKTYVDTELGKKANADVTYTKTEVDGLVSPKADKSYVDEELAKKANASDFVPITNSEIDALFA